MHSTFLKAVKTLLSPLGSVVQVSSQLKLAENLRAVSKKTRRKRHVFHVCVTPETLVPGQLVWDTLKLEDSVKFQLASNGFRLWLSSPGNENLRIETGLEGCTEGSRFLHSKCDHQKYQCATNSKDLLFKAKIFISFHHFPRPAFNAPLQRSEGEKNIDLAHATSSITVSVKLFLRLLLCCAAEIHHLLSQYCGSPFSKFWKSAAVASQSNITLKTPATVSKIPGHQNNILNIGAGVTNHQFPKAKAWTISSYLTFSPSRHALYHLAETPSCFCEQKYLLKKQQRALTNVNSTKDQALFDKALNILNIFHAKRAASGSLRLPRTRKPYLCLQTKADTEADLLDISQG